MEDTVQDTPTPATVDPLSSTEATETTPPAPASQKPPRRRAVPGKGHRKTRKGCYNCKRRRVKCPEGRPECQHCRRLGLDCQYPPLAAAALAPSHAPSAAPAGLSAQPGSAVQLDHLRFFHHFLVAAYPPLPYAMSEVWQGIATLSHEYDFLAKSLLALAAQHLTLFGPADYGIQALDLRVSAIQGLKNALEASCLTPADGDARYAAIIALTYQSSYMPDAMMEFLSMMRGWMLISTTMVPDPDSSLLKSVTRSSFVESMRSHHATAPGDVQNDAMVEGFCESLSLIDGLCRHPAEYAYLHKMQSIARLMETSPIEACLEMVPCYALTNKMSEEDFASFSHPENHTAQILLAHFFLLDYILEMRAFGTMKRPFAFCKRITQAWIVNVVEGLPDEYQGYMIWVLGMAMTMADGSENGALS